MRRVSSSSLLLLHLLFLFVFLDSFLLVLLIFHCFGDSLEHLGADEVNLLTKYQVVLLLIFGLVPAAASRAKLRSCLLLLIELPLLLVGALRPIVYVSFIQDGFFPLSEGFLVFGVVVTKRLVRVRARESGRHLVLSGCKTFVGVRVYMLVGQPVQHFVKLLLSLLYIVQAAVVCGFVLATCEALHDLLHHPVLRLVRLEYLLLVIKYLPLEVELLAFALLEVLLPRLLPQLRNQVLNSAVVHINILLIVHDCIRSSALVCLSLFFISLLPSEYHGLHL